MSEHPAEGKYHSRQEAEAILSSVCGRLTELFPEIQLPSDGWPVSITPPPGPGRRSKRRVPKVRVLPEDLLRPREEVLVVLLHGMVHFANALAGVQDCSRGHYHNRRFKDLAKRVGLRIEGSHPRWGWAATVAGDLLQQKLSRLALPVLPRLAPAHIAESPGPFPERLWRCGFNVGDEPLDTNWRARLPPPKALRLRIQLVREPDIALERYPHIRSLKDAAALCWQVLAPYAQEAVVVLLLDGDRRLIGYEVPYIGALDHATVEPRGVLVPALLTNAASVVVAHNHPSGNLAPSERDYRLTHRLIEAGKILRIHVWASLIVTGPDRWQEIEHQIEAPFQPERRDSLRTLLREVGLP
jgi:DNA repair protein RadC